MKESPRRGWWETLTDPEMMVALSALVVAVTALVVSVLQAQIMRQEQHVSVWPAVSMGVDVSADQGSFEFSAQNKGIGPGIVREFRLEVDGEPITSWDDFERAISPELPRASAGRNQRSLTGVVLLPGEERRVYGFQNPEAYPLLREGLGRVRMTVCYCSVYGRCWISTSDYTGSEVETEPTAVASCKQDEGSFRN